MKAMKKLDFGRLAILCVELGKKEATDSVATIEDLGVISASDERFSGPFESEQFGGRYVVLSGPDRTDFISVSKRSPKGAGMYSVRLMECKETVLDKAGKPVLNSAGEIAMPAGKRFLKAVGIVAEEK